MTGAADCMDDKDRMCFEKFGLETRREIMGRLEIEILA